MTSSIIKSISKLAFPYQTQSPFLFCVYHIDDYPKRGEKLRAGSGSDFDWSQDYRMYHGRDVPGFPSHPHRGFETITAVVRGTIDHADSLGNCGRLGDGDVQYMTAGRGVVHSEMFPLKHEHKRNYSKFFQLWLNLPRANKMVEPTFVVHWGETVPVRETSGGASVTVWVGRFELDGELVEALPPPEHSYAAVREHDVGVLRVVLPPGASCALPASAVGSAANRRVYVYEGDGELHIGDDERRVPLKHEATLDAGQPLTLRNTHATEPVEVLLLQGKPIDEPVVKHGPFVMNSRAEIHEAFADYQETQFGGWPWPKSDMHFPLDKERFAKLNGKEFFPPTKEKEEEEKDELY